MIDPSRLAELEFEALQQEKRDKLNSRLQVWSLLVGLVGASGVASVQSGSIAYVVLLYPLLAACVARYAGHSECVLNQVKAYLLQLEQKAGYSGYEQFNKLSKRKTVGDHMRALRDAVLITDVLAVLAVVVRMFSDGLYMLAVLVVLAALAVIMVTCKWLNSGKERRNGN